MKRYFEELLAIFTAITMNEWRDRVSKETSFPWCVKLMKNKNNAYFFSQLKIQSVLYIKLSMTFRSLKWSSFMFSFF